MIQKLNVSKKSIRKALKDTLRHLSAEDQAQLDMFRPDIPFRNGVSWHCVISSSKVK